MGQTTGHFIGGHTNNRMLNCLLNDGTDGALLLWEMPRSAVTDIRYTF